MSEQKKHIHVDELMEEIRSGGVPRPVHTMREDLFRIAVPGVHVDDVKAQVRALLAEKREQRTQEPTITPELLAAIFGEPADGQDAHLSSKPEAATPRHVNELLGLQDEDFINQAYKVMLGRNPDHEGFEHFLNLLRSGDMTKHEILGRMRLSAEGRRQGTKLKGLPLPFILHTLRRLPVIGRLLYTFVLMANLPTFVRNFQIVDNSIHRRFVEQDRFIREVNAEREALAAKCDDLSERSVALRGRVDELEQAGRHAAEIFQSIEEHVEQTRGDFERLQGQLEQLQGHLLQLEEHGRGLQEEQSKIAEFVHKRSKEQQEWDSNLLDRVNGNEHLLHQVVDDTRRMNHEMIGMTEQMGELQDSFRYLLADVEVGMSKAAPEGAGSSADEPANVPIEFYSDLENAFRGSRDEIVSRQKSYLPLLQEARENADGGGVLDLGCGRGEWLEICAEEKIQAVGVDTNPKFVDLCRSYDLEVELADVFDYLPELEDASLSMVTAFHLIEHLQPMQLMALIAQVRRVLRPGGVVLFETPNPENLNVGSHRFYIDPTHRNPIPPITGSFLLQYGGFAQVEVLRLHPEAGESFGDERLNTLLLGPQDYAVIGRKPK